MKKVLFLNFFLIVLYSQDSDSLFSSKLNLFTDDMPTFPLVLNKIFTGNHILLVDSLNKLQLESNEIFRLQIFESTESSIARAEAKRFQNILGDTVYIDFETPLYKLRIGNFPNRKQAENAMSAIENMGVKDPWVIRTFLHPKN